MNAPKYVTTSLESERYLQHSLELHQKRLKEISGKTPGNYPCQTKYQLRKKKNFNSGIHYTERELDKKNLKLLEKLISITQNKEKNLIRSLTPAPKTLNSINRKKEAYRINEENRKIVDRIVSKSPVLSSKLFQKEYEMQCRYRELLSKVGCIKPKRSFSSKKYDNSHSMNNIHAIRESEEYPRPDGNNTLKNL